MREAGFLSSKELADQFIDLLYHHDIVAEVRDSEEGQWEIWVHDEDYLARVQSLLSDFSIHKKSSKKKSNFDVHLRDGAKKRKSAHKKPIQLPSFLHSLEITRCLIGVCGLLFVWSFISQLLNLPPVLSPSWYFRYSAEAIVYYGQIWRLITPIFLHANFFHFAFNMFWIFSLGEMVEADKGRKFFIIFVLCVAFICNILQNMASGPNFLGISGIVYALAGFIWIKIQLSPGCPYHLSNGSFFLLVIWFFLSASGVMGIGIANTSHGVGLGCGMSFGLINSHVVGNWKSVFRLQYYYYFYLLISIIFSVLGMLADGYRFY